MFDSALGTALQAAGQPAGTGSEEMNLISPETVFTIHIENIKAGSDVITSNTFGVTQMMMRGDEERGLACLSEGLRIAVAAANPRQNRDVSFNASNALDARGEEAQYESPRSVLVALSIGPSGMLFEPFGDMTYESAEEVYTKQAKTAALCGADFILLETFSDVKEFVCAAGVAKKETNLPVLGTMSFDKSGHTFMGATPADFVRESRACGLTAIGANCSLGPDEMIPVITEIIAENNKNPAPLPIIAQPNAGQPVYKNGRSVYEISSGDFAAGSEKLLGLGTSAIGGCCGSTTQMIAALRGIIDANEKDGK